MSLKLTNKCILLIVIFTGFSNGQTNKPPGFLTDGDLGRFSLREDTAIGDEVYTLKAIDPEGSRITYGIESDYFEVVDANNGVVKLIKALDREKQDTVKVVISATDEKLFGTTPNTVHLKREITVLDANDNAPKFHNAPYVFYVDETTKEGTVVFDGISVTDEDSGVNAEITLSCVVEMHHEACDKFSVYQEQKSSGKYQGSITLKSPVDYEDTTAYLLQIRAEDSSSTGRKSSFINVIIQVKDSQDQPPTFLNGPYFAAIAEGTPMKIPVLTVQVQDGDRGNPRPLNISISDEKGHFRLAVPTNDSKGLYSATIETSDNLLDREEQFILKSDGQYTFQIKAVDMADGQPTSVSSETMVTILVSDVNDNMPKMSSEDIYLEIPEDIPNGSLLNGFDLLVEDTDIGDNGRYTLSLESNDASKSIFAVEPTSSSGKTPVTIVVVDNSKLDYEAVEQQQFSFKIVAVDDLGRKSKTSVTVTLKDSNDNDPQFVMDQYVIKAMENSIPSTILANITATDADSGMNAELSYVLSGFGAEWFSVNSTSGEISVADCGMATCLDYERTQKYILTYTARDGFGRASAVQLVIHIQDVNDNRPSFAQKELIRNTPAQTKEFVPLLIVKATDRDSTTDGNNNITYSIIDSDSTNETFTIDPITGEIRLLKPLVAFSETQFTNSYTVHVEAKDGGTPSLTGDAFVVVTMTGESGHRQLFFVHPMYNASVLETALEGTKVAQVAAVDTTLKDPAITYLIASGARDNFIIDPSTGIISVAPNTTLDLDSSPADYTVAVEATSSLGPHPQTATTTVRITVEDVNNKPPRFTQDFYVAHLSEKSPLGTSVQHILATDPDKDSLLQYSILESVMARDRTGVLLNSDTVFDFKKAFHINATSGELTLRSSLYHSGASVVYLQVKVVDRNANNRGVEQISTVDVMIYVEEVKDLNPTFPPPWTVSTPEIIFSIPEEPLINSVLFTLTAKNPMGNGLVTFTAINESEDSYVSINKHTGSVTLLRRLDFEELPEQTKHISFVVQAEAKSSNNASLDTRSSSATVIIDVQDINDNSPIFTEQSYHVSIPESTVHPHNILVVKATDKDQQYSFGEIQYSLSGDGADIFTIDPLTGTISLVSGKFLDRENKFSYNLKVTATDNPQGNGNQQRASALVFVEVLDVNDNAPAFVEPLYQAIIPETVAPGFNIHQVKAVDGDTGASGQVTYSLGESSHLKEFLTVNETTGMLRVSKALSSKGRSEPYKVIITATDNGELPLSSDVHVLLFITDVSSNDGVPTIIRPQIGEIVNIPENLPSGTVILSVEATDPDDPTTDSGRIRYSFLGDGTMDSDQRHFAIDPLKGTITTRSSLDREAQDQYTVIIIVKDLGSPPQHSSRSLTIKVTDEDDHAPQFMRPKNSVALEMQVEEEVPMGTVIGYVQATDEDEGDNAIIQYIITGGNEDGSLAINQTKDNHGVIYVSGRVDRENADSHTLTVKARRPKPSFEDGKEGKKLDSSLTSRERNVETSEFGGRSSSTTQLAYDPTDLSMVQVRIHVRDIDDNPPVFTLGNTTTGIRANVVPGTDVFTFQAVDADATPLPITYKLKETMFYFLDHDESHPVDIAFEIDTITGVLRTVTSMIHYEKGYFILSVEANSNNKTDTTSLTVFVLQGREMLKFVFNKPLAEVRKSLSYFRQDLQKTIHSPLPLTVNLYDSHFAAQESVANVSSLCFQFINGDSIMTTKEAEALLDLPSRPKLGIIYRNYGVEDVENCAVEGKLYTMNWMEIAVLVIAALIAIVAIVSTITICNLHHRYKRKMHRTMYQVIRGAVASDTNGNGYSTIDRQRIHEWRERGAPPPMRDVTYGTSFA